MVLAGGASRRLDGAPKGLELVGGIRIIDRVVSALRDHCDEIVLAANARDASEWLPGAAIVRDAKPGLGGLAGVQASLELGRNVIVVAWDMPFVTADLVGVLAACGQQLDTAVVVPTSDSPHGIEPFCAFYSSRVRDSLASFLEAGGGAAHTFLEQTAGVRRLAASEIRPFGDPRRLLFSVNTNDDLDRARAMAQDTE